MWLTGSAESVGAKIRQSSKLFPILLTCPLQPCFVVGYVGRLSVEKSVGLFVTAAKYILNVIPHARFAVLGGGALLPYLQALTRMFGISFAFHFPGMIVNQWRRATAQYDSI